MKVFVCFIFFLTIFNHSLSSLLEEDKIARRIHAYLLLGELQLAKNESTQALLLYPDSASLHEIAITALAQSGDEKVMLQVWETYQKRFPDTNKSRELIEEMAWGILNKAAHSPSLVMRQMALLAAFYSREGKGIAILHEAMNDPNYAIRAIAVKMASHFRDKKLIDEIKRLFKQEKAWEVRKNVLEAIGSMKILDLRSELEDLIASNESLIIEKAIAISSLLQLLETINRPEIERLVMSNRAGLRMLTCKAIAYFQSERDLDQLLFLTNDHNPEVRFEAYQAIGLVRPKEDEAIIIAAKKGALDQNFKVALAATWLLTLYLPDEGQQEFVKFFLSEHPRIRYLASAALSATGVYGKNLAIKQFQAHSDPYVRMNLAIGLIKQRLLVKESLEQLRQMLSHNKEKWSSQKNGIFRYISKHRAQERDVLTTPDMENQMIRLELLNVLAIMEDPGAQLAIRNYLSGRAWGISATAAALLLTEGDESAFVLVRNLLKDSQPHVRLQAILILSLWGREEAIIQLLEQEYMHVNRDLKARLLEGMGRIASMRSVPFLISSLKEPSETLRLIAALGLIQCLNH